MTTDKTSYRLSNFKRWGRQTNRTMDIVTTRLNRPEPLLEGRGFCFTIICSSQLCHLHWNVGSAVHIEPFCAESKLNRQENFIFPPNFNHLVWPN